MRTIWSSLVFLVFFGFGAYAEQFNFVQDTDHTLHAYFFVDSQAGTIGDDITDSCMAGVKTLDSLLAESFPDVAGDGTRSLRHLPPNANLGDEKHTYRYHPQIFSEKLSASSILGRLKPGFSRRKVESSDGLFVFYCGHGAMNEKREHFLTMSGGNLARTRLWQQIEDLHKSLGPMGFDFIGLVTEACSGVIPSVTFAVPFSGKKPSIDPDILTYLFFKGGRVDMTSASPNQSAWSLGIGLFTSSLVEALANKKWDELVKSDNHKFPAWIDAFSLASELTQSKFAAIKAEYSDRSPALRDSQNQVPYAWRMQHDSSYVVVNNRTGGPVNIKYQMFQPDTNRWSPEFTILHKPSYGGSHLPNVQVSMGTSLVGSHLRWKATTASGKTLGDWNEVDIRNILKPVSVGHINRYDLILD